MELCIVTGKLGEEGTTTPIIWSIRTMREARKTHIWRQLWNWRWWRCRSASCLHVLFFSYFRSVSFLVALHANDDEWNWNRNWFFVPHSNEFAGCCVQGPPDSQKTHFMRNFNCFPERHIFAKLHSFYFIVQLVVIMRHSDNAIRPTMNRIELHSHRHSIWRWCLVLNSHECWLSRVWRSHGMHILWLIYALNSLRKPLILLLMSVACIIIDFIS